MLMMFSTRRTRREWKMNSVGGPGVFVSSGPLFMASGWFS